MNVSMIALIIEWKFLIDYSYNRSKTTQNCIVDFVINMNLKKLELKVK